MHVNRRAFLVAGLGASFTLRAQAAAIPLLDRGFARIGAIAEGVYATIADRAKGEQCYSNGGIIAGRDAVLIVEGHFQPAGAELEIEAARRVSRAPIVGAVNTHFHLDHTFGNAGYARQNVRIFGHERVGPLIRDRFEVLKNMDRKAFLTWWEDQLAAAADPAERARKAGDLRLMQWLYDAVNRATLAYPTDPLAAAELPKRIDLGGLTAVIEFLPGHSPTDLIVRVPERGVVFAGDLFFPHAYPTITVDSDILAWRQIVDRLAAEDPRAQFVPGHGAVGSVHELRRQADVMDRLREHAEKMMRAGASIEEAERRYDVPESYRDYDMLSWRVTVGSAVRSYFAALSSSRP
jgi:glyoxylase-like metal-dependent hydrolase (beta-lactamase superfamily II)